MIIARFVVNTITRTGAGEKITMNPVYSSDPSNPNKSFSDATPSGVIELFISNKAAHGKFELGKEYDITFTERSYNE